MKIKKNNKPIVCPICGEPDSSNVVSQNTIFGQAYDIYFCTTCTLYYLFHQPSETVIKEYYRKEYYANQQRSVFSYMLRSWFSKMRALSQYYYIEQFTSFTSGKKVLEIGSSDGSLLELFKQNGWDVKGLEYSEFSIDKAWKKHHIELEPIDIFKINPDHSTFNLILFSHVLEHMNDPIDVLKHCKKLLIPGGIIFIELPHAPLNFECSKNVLSEYLNTTHLFDFRTISLTKMIHKAELSVESMDRYFYTIPQICSNYAGIVGKVLMTSVLPVGNPVALFVLLMCIININIRFLLKVDPMMKLSNDSPWIGFGDMIRAIARTDDI